MRDILIERTPNADTRTAEGDVTKMQLYTASEKHCYAVKFCLSVLAEELDKIGYAHDYTKLDSQGIEQFYQDFRKTRETGADFTELPWYRRHLKEERHHLNQRCPDDVNLLDVLEMVADCCMAGLARKGEVFPVDISDEILQKAVQNTVKLIKEHTKVLSDD